MTTPRHGRDAGFTLIEMIVVVTLIGIVGTVFATAAVQSINVTTSTSDSLAGSSARVALITHLGDDIRSATQIGAGPQSMPGCASPTNGSEAFWMAQGDQADAGPATPYVVTGYFTVAGTDTELLRQTCTTTTGPPVAGAALQLANWTSAVAPSLTQHGSTVVVSLPLAGADGPDGFSLTITRRTG